MKFLPSHLTTGIAALSLLLGLNASRADSVTNTTAATTTWTAPAGVTSVQVECWGAGGAGGSATVNTTCGGGGGGGAYSKATITVVPGTGYTVIVGAGGTATTPTTGTFGNPGGDTSFNGTSVLAKGGGGGGNAAVAGARGTGGAGGASGSGIGTVVYSGGSGANAPSSSAFAGCGGGSAGNASVGNNGPTSGGTGATAVADGGPGGNPNATSGSSGNGQSPATGPGGGAGGARSSGSAHSGGTGFNGQVILTYTVVFDHVNVETAVDGSGSTVSAQNVSSGSSITVYAIGRAANDAFMSNAPAVWSLINKSGGVVNGDLVASTDGKSATFTAHLAGSANIQAVIGSATANPSGLITVPSTGVVGDWNVDADGPWSTAADWSSNPSIPGSAGDTAILGVGSVLRTVTLDSSRSLGALNFTNANSFVIAGDSTLTMDNSGGGSAIVVSGGTANLIQTPVLLNDTVAVSVSSGDSLAFSGAIANTSAAKTFTANGTGTTILSVANTYGPASSGTVGTVLTGGGTLQIGNNASLGAGDVSFTGNATLQAGTALTVANNVAIGSGTTATVDNNGNNISLGGTISGSGSLAQINSGKLTLSGANSYSGSTTVGAGVLSIASDSNLGTAPGSATPNSLVLGSSTADLLLTGSATLNATRGVGLGAASGATGSTALIDVAASQSASINGIIASAGNTGANGLTINSGSGNTGTLTLGGANTFSGTTIIDAGSLILGNSLALQDSTLDYDNQGGSLSFGSQTAASFGGLSGGESLSLLNSSSAAVALTVGGNNSSTTYSGSLGGAAASLAKTGTGTLILSGNNSLTGSVNVNAGVLQLNPGGVLDLTAGSANVASIGGSELLVAGGALTSVNAANIGKPSTGLLVSSGSATFVNGITFTPNINATALVEVTGGTLTLSNLSLTRSSVSVSAQPAAGSTADDLYVNGGTVNISSNLTMLFSENSSVNARIDSGSLNVGGVLSVALNNSGRWSVMDVNGGSLTVTDAVTGVALGGADAGNAILLMRNGTASVGKITLGYPSVADTVVVSQTNGSLYIGAGGIALGGSAATANVSLGGGILGALSDWSSSVPMTLGGTTIQAADASGAAHAITLSGVLSGTTLTKTGNGTLTLGGLNNYTGATSVTNGALVVNGSIGSGAVTVTNATLSGVGIIGGATTLQPDSVLAAGNSGSGTLAFSGALTLDPASTNNFVVTTVGGAANKVTVAGLLTPNNSVIRVASGTALHPGTNTLFTYGTVSGSFSPTVVFDVAPVHPASIVDDLAGHINLAVPNVAPVAAPNTYSRNGLNNWQIQISDLLTNATDADGDTLSLVGVSSSTNGVALSISGGYVQYSNPNHVDDQFTYTVTDGFGGTNSAVITLLNGGGGAGVAGQVNSFTANGGSASMTFAGIPGYTYNVERSTDMASWSIIWTTNAPSGGLFQFSDDPAPQPNAFYRLTWNGN